MSEINLSNPIIKTIESTLVTNVDANSIDFNEFNINPSLKTMSFQVEYYDPNGDLIQIERKSISGAEFDLWISQELSTLLAVRGSLINYLKSTGEIVGDVVDTTPSA